MSALSGENVPTVLAVSFLAFTPRRTHVRLNFIQKEEEQARLQINLLQSQILENQVYLEQAQGNAQYQTFKPNLSFSSAKKGFS
jgi:hypothetical protein